MLRDLDLWMEAEMEQNLCLFCCSPFCCEHCDLLQVFERRLVRSQVETQRARTGSLEESIREALL